MKIAIMGNIHDDGLEFLKKNNCEILQITNFNEEYLKNKLSNVDGIIIRTATLSANTLSECKNLKIISRHGVGYDNIDTDYIEKNKIALGITGTSNAVSVVNAISPKIDILFLPDMFLGSYVAKMTGRKNMFIWAGECHVHAGITPSDIDKKLESMKNAEFLIHPECSCTSPMLYDLASGSFKNRQVQVLSTEGMMRYAKNSTSNEFVVATETGILYRMKQENPTKTFVPASEKAECQYMKMITLDNVYDSLVNEKFEVKVPKNIAQKARLAINRMLSIS